MNTQRLLNQYPDWHKQPFRLSVEEMENPYLVLEEFFEAYNLIQVRAFLREWVIRAMHGDNSRPVDLLYFYEHVEGLIEAALVLQLKKQKELIDNTDDK